jgi:hypothetical protein
MGEEGVYRLHLFVGKTYGTYILTSRKCELNLRGVAAEAGEGMCEAGNRMQAAQNSA